VANTHVVNAYDSSGIPVPASFRAESRGTNAGNICGTACTRYLPAAGAGNAAKTGNEGCNGAARRGDRAYTNEILTTRAAQKFLQIYLCRAAKPQHSFLGFEDGFENVDVYRNVDDYRKRKRERISRRSR